MILSNRFESFYNGSNVFKTSKKDLRIRNVDIPRDLKCI